MRIIHRLLFTVFIVVILLPELLMCSDASATDPICFSVVSKTVNNGTGTVTVPICITNNPGFASADIQIDSKLTIIEIHSNAFQIFYSAKTGNINWSNTQNSTATGDVIAVTFSVPENAEPGSSWDVQLHITEIIDENANAVPYAITNGKVSIRQSTPEEPEVTEPTDPTEPIQKPSLFRRLFSFIMKIVSWLKRVFHFS